MSRFVLAAAITAVLLGPAGAEETATRHRGTVESRDGEVVTIRRAEGGTVQVLMNARTRLLTATDGSARDIKPESYISVIAVPGADGRPKPAEVAIYSPSERGFEQGTQAWDTAPGATLTAGWVDGLSPMPERRVTLRYEGGQATFTIPQGIEVTQVVPGEKALVVPGAAITAFTRKGGDGVVHGDLLAVGRRGASPSL